MPEMKRTDELDRLTRQIVAAMLELLREKVYSIILYGS